MRAAVVFLAAGCSSASLTGAPIEHPAPSAPIDMELARFMREAMNVPYSVAVMEHSGAQRPIRFRRVAMVLHDAVRDLVHWEDPPVKTASARDVFFTYARQLEREVSTFEAAARTHDLARTTEQLERIRQTCNSCHHFFRPASVISADVLVERFVLENKELQ